MADPLTPEEKAEAYKLYQDLQMLLAGHRVGVGLTAATNSLAAAIAFAAADPAQANRLVDSTAEDLKTIIRNNWAYSRELRAQSPRTGAS